MNRINKLQQKLKEKGIEALLITNLYNLRYIANFTGTTGLAVVTTDAAFFVTDARYTEQVKKQCVGFEIVQNLGPIFYEVKKIAEAKQIKQLGIEDAHLSVAQFNTLNELMAVELVPASGLIEQLRLIKDASELDLMRTACQMADKAFEYILGEIKPGITEIEVANKLDFYMRSLGASGVSFNTIVASGFRSALPHGVASDKIIEKGDIITLDYGCYYNGYPSDMTRTIALGEPKHAQLKEVHAVVLAAQELTSRSIKVGMSCQEMDKIARDSITKAGYGDYFVHSTGHGVGLEVHELPFVNKNSEAILTVGNVVTNEPGIYLPGIGGVRIEDDIFVTESGIEVVTKSNRELIIL